MNDTPRSEQELDPFEQESTPLRAWEQAALKELVTILQGLCSCGYPQPGDVVFALRDVAACLEEQYIGTQGREMTREILSALTGHISPPGRYPPVALPAAVPHASPHPGNPIAWLDGQPVYPDDIEQREDEHEHS